MLKNIQNIDEHCLLTMSLNKKHLTIDISLFSITLPGERGLVLAENLGNV
jgi:hypothetical protein